MAAIDPSFSPDEAREARRARRFTRINKADNWFRIIGIAWMTPILRAIAGDNPAAQLREVWKLLGVPVVAIIGFLMAWAWLAPQVQTSLGAVPGPAQVWEQAVVLHEDAVRKGESEDAFYERQDERNAKLIADGREDRVKWREYTGAPS